MIPARSPRRRIAVVTGTRAEYGLLRSTLEAIRRHARLELQLVVTGTHLLSRFGSTARFIEADGFLISARVAMQQGGDGALDQAVGLARGVAGIARFLDRAGSDVVLVLGDRIEAMAGALAGTTTGRVVAHLHGGDVAPGDFDDALRHAITKLAHLHFTATAQSARRVLRLGEQRERVIQVGAPGLDELRAMRASTRRRSEPEDAALIVQHPCGRAADVEAAVMRRALRAVERCGLRRWIIYPNSDRGHAGIIEAIAAHAARSRDGQVEVFKSLPRRDFLERLMRVRVLVGNSSSGIIEAPFLGTPSVNIGIRQEGRQPGGRSVLHAGEDYPSILSTLQKAAPLTVVRPKRSAYGDGRTGERVAERLAGLELTPSLRRKRIRY